MEHSDKKIGELDVTVVQGCETPKGAVILCHGFGAERSDLASIVEEMIKSDKSFRDIVFLFPDGPENLDAEMGFKARAWWMIDSDLIERLAELDEFQELKSSSPAEVPRCTELINGLIEHVHWKFDLPHSRIIVGGFSQGAMVTTDVALSFDRPLGGLIVWSGTLICEDKWSELAGKHRFPVYQSHGTEDPILPFSVAVDLCNLFADASLDNVFTEFEGPHVIDVGAMKGAMKLIRKACL